MHGTTKLGLVVVLPVVSCKDSSPTISNNIMHDNTANFGRAIHVDGGAPLIVGSVFFDDLAKDCHEDHLCGNGGRSTSSTHAPVT